MISSPHPAAFGLLARCWLWIPCGFCWVLATVLCAAEPPPAAAPTPEQEKFFETKVRPVLAAQCFKCHGSTKQESGFRLDTRAGLLEGGESGKRGAVPGEPARSVLVQAIMQTGDLKMPPDGKLTQPEIDAITTWVQQGMPWPAASSGEVKPLSMHERVEQARGKQWSLRPVVRPPLPTVSQPLWLATPVDAFVLKKLTDAKLTPSRRAERPTLLRRLSFDLHGLPPTPAELADFVADPAPDAYERLVDRLLASPRYGERWGRHWLDVARYADTKGYAFTNDRRYPYSYTYRDYVIDAFNRDLPYDQFIVEQLAADRLPPAEDKRPLAAMGFLTVGRKFNNQPDDIDDLIDVVTRGLMGLTVACARCHDHKYDAIPTEDYYSLYGVFASSNQPGELPIIASSKDAAGQRRYEEELKKFQAELDGYDNKIHAALLQKVRRQSADYLLRVAFEENALQAVKALDFLSDSAKDLRPKLLERWREFVKQRAAPPDPVWGLWLELMTLPADNFAPQAKAVLDRWNTRPEGVAPGQFNRALKAALAASGGPQLKTDVPRIFGGAITSAVEAWQKGGGNDAALASLGEDARQLAQIVLAADVPASVPRPEIQHYFNRQEQDDRNQVRRKLEEFQATSPNAPPRAMVLADNPQPTQPVVFIRGNPGRHGKSIPRQFLTVLAGPQRQPFTSGSGRLELARAIAAPENPLTRRVVVNRIWMQHMGEPLALTPSDFGVRSDPPSHPELLDYLADDLLASGWSLKRLQRQIVCSNTYRQASLDRPGPKTADPENRLLWRMNRRRLELEAMRDTLLAAADRLDSGMGGKPVEITTPPFSRRRAVYGYIDRQDLPNFFRVFDIASPDQSSPRRPRTTVPQQSLFFMNSPFVVEQAQALAARADVQAAAPNVERIDRLYQILFSRPATAEEIQLGQKFFTPVKPTPDIKLTPWEQYCQILLLTNELMYID